MSDNSIINYLQVGDDTYEIADPQMRDLIQTEATGSLSHGVANGDLPNPDGQNPETSYTHIFLEPYESDPEGALDYEGQNKPMEVTVGKPRAVNKGSHAEGSKTLAYGITSHAEGDSTLARHGRSHAEGTRTVAWGARSHAEGADTIAYGINAHAEGESIIASPLTSSTVTVQNKRLIDIIKEPPAEKTAAQAIQEEWQKRGAAQKFQMAYGNYSHVENSNNLAIGARSHAEGQRTLTVGTAAHSEGIDTTASGNYSHAEGKGTLAQGESTHAEGYSAKAIGKYSHAEGNGTLAQGESTHAEGGPLTVAGVTYDGPKATGLCSHAEGSGTNASGRGAHAEGFGAQAKGNYSHAQGMHTEVNGRSGFVIGEYNILDTPTYKKDGITPDPTSYSQEKWAFIVGNGTGDTKRSNAHTLDWDGNAWFKKSIKVGGTGEDDANAKEIATKDDLAEHDLILDRLRTVTDDVVIYDNAIEGYPLEVISHIDVVQKGEGDASPDNIRPVVAHSTVSLTQDGRNLVMYPYSEKNKTLNGITFTNNGDGSITINGTATDDAYLFFGDGKRWNIIPGKEYTAKLHKISGSGSADFVVNYYPMDKDSDTSWISTKLGIPKTEICPADYSRIAAYALVLKGKTCSNLIVRPQLEYGTVATEYAPYKQITRTENNTFTMDLGQAIYGGSLDWNTGILTQSYAVKIFDGTSPYGILTGTDPSTKEYAYTSTYPSNKFRPKPQGKAYANKARIYLSGVSNIVAMSVIISPEFTGVTDEDIKFEQNNANSAEAARQRVVKKFNDLISDWNKKGEPLIVVYELETPIKIELTPQELQALEGTNILYSNTGKTSVKQDYIQIDTTLTKSGNAADAKVVGDTINTIKEELKIATDNAVTVEQLKNATAEVSKAKQLSTSRTITVNLSSESGEKFDGSADVKLGVTNILSKKHGGTGNSSGYIRAGQKAGTTIGEKATAEGDNNTASGDASHAEGYHSIASGQYSHAEGCSNAGSLCSHAEGNSTVETNAAYAHAEGGSTASGKYSHAEGYDTKAVYEYSHAEGKLTQALAESAHTEGYNTIARGQQSHASGWRTNAYGRCQFVIGKFNLTEGDQDFENGLNPGQYAFIIGNGSYEQLPGNNQYDNYLRSNAFTVDWEGKTTANSTQAQGADYAEMFEWNDNNPLSEDRIGYLVTLINGNKIQFAQPGNDYLGIISDTTAVLGDSAQFEWQGKYLTDDFGRPIYEEAPEYNEIFNEETGESEFVVIGTTKKKKLNPNYNPGEAYKPRTERKEWAKVGLLGKIYARDDGSCEVGHYATAGLNGALTYSAERTNMRVMKRVSENVVLVFLK